MKIKQQLKKINSLLLKKNLDQNKIIVFFKYKIPRQQNTNKFRLMIKLPKMKDNGKVQKNKFIKKIISNFVFCLLIKSFAPIIKY